MAKRTPLQKYISALEAFESALLDAQEESVIDMEQTHRAETDPNLSPGERLDIFRALQAWPRIVLGLYNAELAIAQSDRKENGDTDHNDKPSDIAHDIVGEALGLGPDRIRDLCKEGRRHLNEGMPRKIEIRAAEFVDKILRGQPTLNGRQKP